MKKQFAVMTACAMMALAHGQLVISTTATGSGIARAMYYDIASNTTTTLWNSGANNSSYGIYADDANGKIWFTTGARIGSATYGAAPMTATAIAGIYFPDNTNVANAWDLTGANGNLYTWTRGNGTYTRGIYQAPTVPNAQNHLPLTQLWLDSPTTGNQYDFQGLAFRTQNGLFYGVNNSTDHALGLYTIDAFGAGAVNFLAAMPAGHTHVDGLAVDGTGNTLYMTEHNPTDLKIYIFAYSLTTQTYGDTYSIAYSDTTQRGTGVSWSPNVFTPVPEPASLAVLAIGGLFLRRRRAKR